MVPEIVVISGCLKTQNFYPDICLKLLSAILIFFGFSVALSASGNENILLFDGNEISFVSGSDTLFLGQRKQGTHVSFRMVLKNESDIPLWVSNVRGSCGLSIPSWPRNPIEPGDESIIQLRFDASSPGSYTRILTIHSNSRDSRTIIPIVATITP
ncbi:MAG: DUF1573 domain-containing protein [Bacteroidetes bacterium]|nr:MAG: DUF1573 domain-containing protein [Bacteroidota bacterium]